MHIRRGISYRVRDATSPRKDQGLPPLLQGREGCTSRSPEPLGSKGGVVQKESSSGNGVTVADHRRRAHGEANHQQQQQKRPPSFLQGHRHGHPEARLRHKEIRHDDGVPGGEEWPAAGDEQGDGAGEAADERGEATAADQGGEGGPAVGGGARGAVAVGGGAAWAAVQGGGARGAVRRHRPRHARRAAQSRAPAAGRRPRRRVHRPRAVPVGGGRPGRRRSRLRRRRLRHVRRLQLRVQAPGLVRMNSATVLRAVIGSIKYVLLCSGILINLA